MIYEPAEDSYLLSEFVRKLAFGKVLDLGTGSGIQAVEALKSKKVKSVLADDVSDEAVTALKNKLKKAPRQNNSNNNYKLKNNKLKIIKSDLFSNIKGRFDTIIFNPPYLPLDKREPIDSQLATTGGKHGYETLAKFVNELNDHLTKNGFALIVFSSLTNKMKIDEFIINSGFEFELLKEQKISFEILYCYKIKRNWLLNNLFGKITDIKLLMKGHRGLIFTGNYHNKKVAIKAQRLELKVRTVDREALIIKKLNRYKLAPKIIMKGHNYFIYEYIPGEFIIDYLEHSSKSETENLLLEVLRQCRILDKIHITKEEMTNPYKHVIVNKKVVLVDFERAHFDLKPTNISQFSQYIMRNHDLLNKKGIRIDKEKLIRLTKHYKNNQSNENYSKIKNLISAL